MTSREGLRIFLKQTWMERDGSVSVGGTDVFDKDSSPGEIRAYRFEVRTNLRVLGAVECATKGRLLHIESVFLEEDVRGMGLSRQILHALSRHFKPEAMTLHAGSLLPEHRTREARFIAEQKLIKHWIKHGFHLVDPDGNLLLKNMVRTNVSAQEGGAPCSARCADSNASRPAGASSSTSPSATVASKR